MASINHMLAKSKREAIQMANRSLPPMSDSDNQVYEVCFCEEVRKI
jgi:hypothetical protein